MHFSGVSGFPQGLRQSFLASNLKSAVDDPSGDDLMLIQQFWAEFQAPLIINNQSTTFICHTSIIVINVSIYNQLGEETSRNH